MRPPRCGASRRDTSQPGDRLSATDALQHPFIKIGSSLHGTSAHAGPDAAHELEQHEEIVRSLEAFSHADGLAKLALQVPGQRTPPAQDGADAHKEPTAPFPPLLCSPLLRTRASHWPSARRYVTSDSDCLLRAVWSPSYGLLVAFSTHWPGDCVLHSTREAR